jgi:hypothetical protein
MDAWQNEGPATRARSAADNRENLSALHQRLAAHFRDLRERRDNLGHGAPIFALEHGLPDADLALVEAGVLSAARHGRFPPESWLPLVVYATELGYSYSGDEYWQTFESRTPGWAEYGDRPYVRAVFEKFSDAFGGARPSGTWASWFSIISWPITHAVLPADLQRQFARLMFDSRAALTADLLADPGALGLKLAARTGHYSSRFQNFAQNTDLLGQVAAALLAGDDESPYLLASTLRRLTRSLTAERQSRKWLQETRWTARHVRSRGFLPAGRQHPGPAVPQPSGLPAATDPVLSLRHEQGGWTVWLTLPDLAVLAERLPGLHDELGRLRPRVAGAARPVFPRGQLLFPGQPIKLATWPAADAPLIELEGGRNASNAVLAEHCALRAGPWVFRIRDGVRATEIRGRTARPDGRYVLIRRDPLKPGCLPEWVTPATCRTGGVHAYELRVPSLIDNARAEEARILGISLQADVTIRPAGMVAADWDGEGTAEWLAGEDIILAVRTTRNVTRCVFEVAGVQYPLDWPDSTGEIFVTATGLATGTHRAQVLLMSADSGVPVANGTFLMAVRDPSSRPPGGTLREGLTMIPSPATPTLPELWDGRAAIRLLGPAGIRVRAEVALIDGRHAVIASDDFQVRIPLDARGWRHFASTRLRASAALRDAYDDAESCVISVSEQRLGRAEMRCEREFAPVRWICGNDHDGPFARLVDNTEDGTAAVSYFGFAAPDQPAPARPVADGRIREASGGLLLARASGFESAVILPPRVRDLADFQRADTRPEISTGPRTAGEVHRLLGVAGMWASETLPVNPLAQRERRSVLRAVTSTIACRISGERWARLEQHARDDTPRISAMEAAVGMERYQAEIARLVRGRLDEWRGKRPEERAADLGSLLDTHIPRARLSPDPARDAELMLRLASEPATVGAWPRREIDAAIERAIVVPVIMRIARFAVLAIHGMTHEDTGTTYRGWEWT